MVPVTLAALGPFVLFKRLLMCTAVKQAGIARVAETAALTHARQTNRHGGVIAVTVVARRRPQITTLHQRAAVNADPVFRQLLVGIGVPSGRVKPAIVVALAWQAPQVSGTRFR